MGGPVPVAVYNLLFFCKPRVLHDIEKEQKGENHKEVIALRDVADSAFRMYIINRQNGDLCDDSGLDHVPDGTFRWKTRFKRKSKVLYTEGPKDKAWMEETDRNYVFRLEREGRLDEVEPNLKTEVPQLYAEIMTARKAKQAELKAQYKDEIYRKQEEEKQCQEEQHTLMKLRKALRQKEQEEKECKERERQERIERQIKEQKLLEEQCLKKLTEQQQERPQLCQNLHMQPSTPLSLLAKAKHQYTATNTDQLSFRKGEVLIIHRKLESGWWWCELNGVQGYAPRTFLVEDQQNTERSFRQSDGKYSFFNIKTTATTEDEEITVESQKSHLPGQINF